ncbi:MAG: SET domain-containing protein-lysine N-methyltransferase, partial [Candidatus Fonsibacter ubiquis]
MHNKKVIIDAIRNLNKTNRFKNTNVKNNFGKKNNMITAEEGVDTPIYKAVSVKPSNIEGKGLFAQQAISKGDIIGVSHIRKNFKSNGQNYVAPVPSKVLGYYNHSENPNVEEVDMGDYIIIKALKNIPFNSELTSNYNKNTSTGLETSDNFEKLKKGGSSKRAQMPSKKNSKAYSRSFEATNRFFAENPLFKKSKSRKNKIFDPNAKYYADGGESGCPEGYYYDPVQGCIPNDQHQKWLRDWYTNRKMSTPEGQEILNKIRPEVLERAKNFPPYSMSEELPENIAAAYDLEKNILELNKFLPEKKLEESKTHELSHYLTSGDKFLNLFDKDNEIAYVVDKNLITKPKKINTGNAKWDEELKKNFDEI